MTVIINRTVFCLFVTTSIFPSTDSSQTLNNQLHRIPHFYHSPTTSNSEMNLIGQIAVDGSFDDNPYTMRHHPLNQCIRVEDSLDSGSSIPLIEDSVVHVNNESQTDGILVMDKGIQTDIIPEKPFIIKNVVQKERFSFCELVAKLCSCDWY